MGTSLLPSAGRIPALMGPGQLCPWGQKTPTPLSQGSSTQSHPKNIVLKHKSRFQGAIGPFFPIPSAVSHKINSITVGLVSFFSMWLLVSGVIS